MSDLMEPREYWGIDRKAESNLGWKWILPRVAGSAVIASAFIALMVNINPASEVATTPAIWLFIISFAATAFLYLQMEGGKEIERRKAKNDTLAMWGRDNWIDNHVRRYLFEEHGMFAGQCIDKSNLTFKARTITNQDVFVKVSGFEENEFSAGEPALFGYTRTGATSVQILKDSKMVWF